MFPSMLKKAGKALKSHEPRKGRTVIRFASVETFAMFDDFAEMSRKKVAMGGNNDTWGRAESERLAGRGYSRGRGKRETA